MGNLQLVQFEPADLMLSQTTDVVKAAAEWFKLDVANGDAREE